jgi:hypothetical protein
LGRKCSAKDLGKVALASIAMDAAKAATVVRKLFFFILFLLVKDSEINTHILYG